MMEADLQQDDMEMDEISTNDMDNDIELSISGENWTQIILRNL